MTRPTNLAQMQAQTATFATPAGYAKGLAYRPDPTDIFISPYAKCGTTWMQQIVHGLRTGGDMEFNEITDVVPWLELAHDLGLDIHAPQKARPHAFKSHLTWHDIPKGGRYIVVLRDPVDAMLSLYRFLDGWHFETGSVSLDDFAEYFLSRSDEDNYWVHAASWWGQRRNENVLLLTYEDMKQDLSATVARVAAFMGGYDSARVALATRQASFGFMKAHAGQFDDNLVRRMRDPACGLPPGGAANKVSSGQTGEGARALSPDILSAMQDKWSETMGAQFALPSYASLLDQVREARS